MTRLSVTRSAVGGGNSRMYTLYIHYKHTTGGPLHKLNTPLLQYIVLLQCTNMYQVFTQNTLHINQNISWHASADIHIPCKQTCLYLYTYQVAEGACGTMHYTSLYCTSMYTCIYISQTSVIVHAAGSQVNVQRILQVLLRSYKRCNHYVVQ